TSPPSSSRPGARRSCGRNCSDPAAGAWALPLRQVTPPAVRCPGEVGAPPTHGSPACLDVALPLRFSCNGIEGPASTAVVVGTVDAPDSTGIRPESNRDPGQGGDHVRHDDEAAVRRCGP